MIILINKNAELTNIQNIKKLYFLIFKVIKFHFKFAN